MSKYEYRKDVIRHAANNNSSSNNVSLRLELVRSVWGIEGDIYEFFKNERKEGKPWEGIEAAWNNCSEEQKDQINRAKKDFNLKFYGLMFSDDHLKRLESVEEHVKEFKRQAMNLLELNPIHITSHSGHDQWSDEQSIEFFKQVLEFQSTLKIPIYHETHRGRILFHPKITKKLLEIHPNLLLTCDISHWVVVCQRLIMDEEKETMKTVIERTRHVHSRVGYEGGPQVSDPRAPEYLPHLLSHERLWEKIFMNCLDRGQTTITVVPEYGPAPSYMHTLPYTQQPVSNLVEICDFAAHRMQQKFLHPDS